MSILAIWFTHKSNAYVIAEQKQLEDLYSFASHPLNSNNVSCTHCLQPMPILKPPNLFLNRTLFFQDFSLPFDNIPFPSLLTVSEVPCPQTTISPTQPFFQLSSLHPYYRALGSVTSAPRTPCISHFLLPSSLPVAHSPWIWSVVVDRLLTWFSEFNLRYVNSWLVVFSGIRYLYMFI